MEKIIGVTELQRRFKSVLDDVVHKDAAYVVARGSRPEADLISYERFQRYQTLDLDALYKRFDLMHRELAKHSADAGEEELAADVAAAIREVRAERAAEREKAERAKAAR